MKTQAYPYVEMAPRLFEIGEFDCASMFLIVGTEQAMLIDTGIGLGDLAGFVRQLTDLPLIVCYTHNHLDHVGGAGGFTEGWIHPADMEWFSSGGGISLAKEARAGYIRMIAEREKGLYPYRIERDLDEWGPMPQLHGLLDGQVFDLGGRRVTAYACAGHTPGSVVFIDDQTKTLFLGDACNGFILLNPSVPPGRKGVSIEQARHNLSKLLALKPAWEQMVNGHYDFRDLGQPLPEIFLSDAIENCEKILSGEIRGEVRPSPLQIGFDMTLAVHGNVTISYDPMQLRG